MNKNVECHTYLGGFVQESASSPAVRHLLYKHDPKNICEAPQSLGHFEGGAFHPDDETLKRLGFSLQVVLNYIAQYFQNNKFSDFLDE